MCFVFSICICISWTRPGKVNLSWIWQSAGLRWRLTEWRDRELGKWPKSILPHIIADPKLHTVEHRWTHFNSQIDTVGHGYTHLTHSRTQMKTPYTHLYTEAHNLHTVEHRCTHFNPPIDTVEHRYTRCMKVSLFSLNHITLKSIIHHYTDMWRRWTLWQFVTQWNISRAKESTVLKSFPYFQYRVIIKDCRL